MRLMVEGKKEEEGCKLFIPALPLALRSHRVCHVRLRMGVSAEKFSKPYWYLALFNHFSAGSFFEGLGRKTRTPKLEQGGLILHAL